MKFKFGDYKLSLIFCSCLLTYFSNYPQRACWLVIVVTFSVCHLLILKMALFFSPNGHRSVAVDDLKVLIVAFFFFLKINPNSSQTSTIKLALICAALGTASCILYHMTLRRLFSYTLCNRTLYRSCHSVCMSVCANDILELRLFPHWQ